MRARMGCRPAQIELYANSTAGEKLHHQMMERDKPSSPYSNHHGRHIPLPAIAGAQFVVSGLELEREPPALIGDAPEDSRLPCSIAA